MRPLGTRDSSSLRPSPLERGIPLGLRRPDRELVLSGLVEVFLKEAVPLNRSVPSLCPQGVLERIVAVDEKVVPTFYSFDVGGPWD